MNTVHPTLAELVADIASRAPNRADKETLERAAMTLTPLAYKRARAAECVADAIEELVREARDPEPDRDAQNRIRASLRDALTLLVGIGERSEGLR